MPESEKEQLIQVLSEIKPPYIWIPYIIIDMYGPAMKKAGWLYTVLNRFKNTSNSSAKVGVRTLALTCGIDTETVQNYADSLEKIGLVKIQPGNYSHPTVYTILLPPLPPPPDIVQQFYPQGWTPPERAKKMLENIRNYLGSEDTPQEKAPKGSPVGTMPTPTEKNQKLTTPSVGTSPTPKPAGVSGSTPEGVGKDPTVRKAGTDGVSAPPGPYKYLLNDSKETTTSASPPAVVEAFLNLSLETFKQKDTTIEKSVMEEFYYKSLNLCEDDEDSAMEYLTEKIKVVMQLKKTADPQAVLWKAILGNWKPRPESQGSMKENEFISIEKMKAEEKKVDEENEIARKHRMTLPLEEIVKVFKEYPEAMELERRLRILNSYFDGNPELEKALEFIKKGG